MRKRNIGLPTPKGEHGGKPKISIKDLNDKLQVALMRDDASFYYLGYHIKGYLESRGIEVVDDDC
jgi:glutathione synthase/RimK-type ligase-like ATP-grasp enzyme